MANFPVYRADPGQSFDYTDGEGNQRRLRADRDGLVHARTSADVAVLTGFELPVARVDAGEDKPTVTKPRGKKAPKLVVDNGSTDTRGPGAPADEPGVADAEEK